MTNPENPKLTGIRYERGRHKAPDRYKTLKKVGVVSVAILVPGGIALGLIAIAGNTQAETLFDPTNNVSPEPIPEFPETPTPPEPLKEEQFIQASDPAVIPYDFIHKHSI